MATPERPVDVSDVLIIGGGPAGLSAALTLARQVHTVTVFDEGNYRNDVSSHMHIVLGWDHADPGVFRQAAKENILARYQTVRFEQVAIQSARKTEEGLFEAVDNDGKQWYGKKLILASGSEDLYPDIQGYADCWGKGIFHCFFCKGYEERDAASCGILAVGSLASPPPALHHTRYALQLVSPVTIYTNGSEEVAQELENELASTSQIQVDSRVIKQLVKGPKGAEVIIQFEDGTEVVEGFLGHAPITQVRGPFAQQLSLELTPKGDLKTNPPFLQTSLTGVFAVGDCSSPMKITPNAQMTGSLAAAGVSAQLHAEALGHKPMF